MRNERTSSERKMTWRKRQTFVVNSPTLKHSPFSYAASASKVNTEERRRLEVQTFTELSLDCRASSNLKEMIYKSNELLSEKIHSLQWHSSCDARDTDRRDGSKGK